MSQGILYNSKNHHKKQRKFNLLVVLSTNVKQPNTWFDGSSKLCAEWTGGFYVTNMPLNLLLPKCGFVFSIELCSPGL